MTFAKGFTNGLTKGDAITITCGERTVEGHVYLISQNQVSAVVMFDAVLDGHVGMMPIFRGDDGVYRALVTGTEIEIEKRLVS